MKSKYLFLLLWMSFTSCYKERTATIVQGRVTNLITGKPTAGVEILVNWSNTKRNSYGNQAKVFTDDSGYYYCKFNADRRYSYSLKGYKDSECYSTDDYENVELKKKNEINMIGLFFGNLILHIVNVSPFDDNDKICLYSGLHLYNFPLCFSGMNVNHTTDKNSGEYVTGFGETFLPLRWEVTKNSITTTYSDSIFINSCVENNYTINY